jgi:hypothetical protein
MTIRPASGRASVPVILPPSSCPVVPSQLLQPQMTTQMAINMMRTTCLFYLAWAGPAPLQAQGVGAAWWGSSKVMGGMHGGADPGADDIVPGFDGGARVGMRRIVLPV